jgi:hypothetical protein
VPVDMPSPEERYLWVDLTYPLRAIYFPQRHIAQPRYPGFCVYSRLSFTECDIVLKKFRIPRPPPLGSYEKERICDDREVRGPKRRKVYQELSDLPKAPPTLPGEQLREGSLPIHPDKWCEWGVQPQWTARFDVKNLMHILTIPREYLLKEYQDPFDQIVLYDCRCVDLIGTGTFTMNPDDHGVDILRVINTEHGVDVEYKSSGFDQFWVVKTIGGLALVGVSLIPGYGPVLAFGGQLLLDLVTDPDIFTAQKFSSDRVPVGAAAGAAQIDQVKTMLAKSAKDAEPYINTKLLNKIIGYAKRRH